jgi:hypothetical protein
LQDIGCWIFLPMWQPVLRCLAIGRRMGPQPDPAVPNLF